MIVDAWLRIVLGLALLLIAASSVPSPARADEPKPYAAPGPLIDQAGIGLGCQRTMTLLATSTPQHHNKVRILFYGQSITELGWWEFVVADLRRRFPDADLDVENRAIGGFDSSKLIRPAEHDVYPYYPDLVIFHVYGDHRFYEQIIRNIRSRTAAEVLIQNDHLRVVKPEQPSGKPGKDEVWGERMSREIIPGIARKYGCGLVDVRSNWEAYLEANRLNRADLLEDDTHLNDHGKFLMGELIKAYLAYRPELPSASWEGLVKTFEVGRDASWEGGRLKFDFVGNRVDVVADPAAAPGRTARVLIDGKSPSSFPGVYASTRPTPKPWSALALTRVDHDKPPLAEDWTLKITSFSDKPPRWQFEVEGSKTGPDGGGSSGATFVSKSGRVRIEPVDWLQTAPIEPGYLIRWTVQPQFRDEYATPKGLDTSREASTTLFQGIPDGSHTLELIAGSGEIPGLKSIRVYDPPISASDFPVVTVVVATTTLAASAGMIFAAREIRSRRRQAASVTAST